MSSLDNRLKRYLYIWLIAAGIGIIIGSLFQSSYFDELKEINDSFFNNISNYPVYMGTQENIFLLFKVICKRILPFGLMWVLEKTDFVIPYIMWFLVSRGFFFGFFVSFMGICYKLKAVKLMFGILFPHMLVYAAVFIFVILCITKGIKRKKRIVVLALAVIMLAGCLMETYLSPVILGGVI